MWIQEHSGVGGTIHSALSLAVFRVECKLFAITPHTVVMHISSYEIVYPTVDSAMPFGAGALLHITDYHRNIVLTAMNAQFETLQCP